jgi:ribosomal-protein-alanine N-acetyltransferase
MPLIPITPLHTPRLTVRGVTAADLSQLLPINADDRVTHHLPYASWQSMADAEAWLARIEGLQAAGGTQQWVLTLRETGAVIGAAVIFKHDEASARAELGYLMSPACWGQGLMREAVAALLDHAFGFNAGIERTDGLRRMEAEVNPLNAPSNALLQGLGFTLEGTLRQRWTAKGRTYDTHLWGLLRDEWLGRAQTPINAP